VLLTRLGGGRIQPTTERLDHRKIKNWIIAKSASPLRPPGHHPSIGHRASVACLSLQINNGSVFFTLLNVSEI
jgi:hypothetical protein